MLDCGDGRPQWYELMITCPYTCNYESVQDVMIDRCQHMRVFVVERVCKGS